jgi:hypothetical protein
MSPVTSPAYVALVLFDVLDKAENELVGDAGAKVVVEEFPRETLIVPVWVTVKVLPEERLYPIVIPRASARTAIPVTTTTTCFVSILTHFTDYFA